MISSYYLGYIYLSSILFIMQVLFSETKNSILLNVMDTKGYKGAIWFAESIRMYNKENDNIYFYIHYDDWNRLKDANEIKTDILDTIKPYKFIYYQNNGPLPDFNIGKKQKFPEHVTDILESWNHFMNMTILEDSHHIVISLAFLGSTIPVATQSFLDIFVFFKKQHYDMMLFEKTAQLTSVSDWHDISIVVFNPNSIEFRNWLVIFNDVYMHHASNRKAFSLLEPRPALLEALAQVHEKLLWGYFSSELICSTTSSFYEQYSESSQSIIKVMAKSNLSYFENVSFTPNKKDFKHPFNESKCNKLSFDLSLAGDISQETSNIHSGFAPIELYCGSNSFENIAEIESNCLLLNNPKSFKFRRLPPKDFIVPFKTIKDGENMLMRLMWRPGILRFRNTTSRILNSFCWDSGNDEEEVTPVNIEFNLSSAVPFQHLEYEKYNKYTSNISALILVGTVGSSASIIDKLYLTMSKMYFAKRHGYKFQLLISNAFVNFFPKDLFSAVDYIHFTGPYFRGIMTKPLMIIDSMLANLNKEWIVWTDDDVYPLPGWTYMPLDAYLKDVPSHKVMVLANYRSTFTNLLAVRNNPQGRRLMYDWLAIVMSGYIQCHGYDQAALGALIAQRISNDSTFSTSQPLGFQCIYNEKNASLGCASDNHRGEGTCDYKFERALWNAGFRTNDALFSGGKISSYTKGCANDYIRDFHIVTETKLRPRWQCGHCTRATEIETSGHWDGPLGGGNDLLRSGAINGYFFNHKAEFLFYEEYLNARACKRMDNLIPFCDVEEVYHNLTYDEYTSLNRNVISLLDGFGYHLKLHTICRITNQNVLNFQSSYSYMKYYPELIDMINLINETNWIQMYRYFSGGEARAPCGNRNSHCYGHGKNKDHQRYRRPLDPKDIIDPSWNEKYFDKEDYCTSQCRPVEVNQFTSLEFAINCRTDSTIT